MNCLHRIFLPESGNGKADMLSPKKSLGAVDGGGVMLSGMTEQGLFGIAEGIETGRAVELLFGVPVWATLSAGNMRTFRPPPGLTTLRIFADRGKDGEEAAWYLRDQMMRTGIDVQVVLPKSDDDFNVDLRLGHTRDEYQPEPPPGDPDPDRSQVGRERPGTQTVQLVGGSLPSSIDRARSILIAGDRRIFRRGDFVVRPAALRTAVSASHMSMTRRRCRFRCRSKPRRR